MYFPSREKERQEAFKCRHWPELGDREAAARNLQYRPGLLPRGYEAKAFFPPLAEDILAYCRKRRVPLQETRKMSSSLVSCLNALFPLRGRPELAIPFLRMALPDLDQLSRIEFHFSGDQEDVPSRPRADSALWWQDPAGKRCLSLICWKYVDSSYGTCGGFRTRNNAEQCYCLELNLESHLPEKGCYLFQKAGFWSPWEGAAEAGIRLDLLRGVRGCPFRGPFCQIMRMFQMAASFRKAGEADRVDVVFVGFRDNRSLIRAPVHLASLGTNLIQAWNRVVWEVPKLRFVLAEDIAAGIRSDDRGLSTALAGYLAERYGLC